MNQQHKNKMILNAFQQAGWKASFRISERFGGRFAFYVCPPGVSRKNGSYFPDALSAAIHYDFEDIVKEIERLG